MEKEEKEACEALEAPEAPASAVSIPPQICQKQRNKQTIRQRSLRLVHKFGQKTVDANKPAFLERGQTKAFLVKV
jgi:hypothetical protein